MSILRPSVTFLEYSQLSRSRPQRAENVETANRLLLQNICDERGPLPWTKLTSTVHKEPQGNKLS